MYKAKTTTQSIGSDQRAPHNNMMVANHTTKLAGNVDGEAPSLIVSHGQFDNLIGTFSGEFTEAARLSIPLACVSPVSRGSSRMRESRFAVPMLLGAVLSFSWASNVMAACTGASPNWTSTPDYASVSACVSNASSGNTINVSAGSATWSSTLALPASKGITLIGAGAASTVITLIGDIDAICSAGKPHRISGFKFQNKTSGTAIAFSGTCSGIRVDHNTFSSFSSAVEGIVIDWFRAGTGPIYGVIDHNTFSSPVNHRAVLMYGLGKNWPSSPIGTGNNVFIEDNTFDFGDITDGSAGSGCADANYGASFVWRNNTSRNCLLSIHGEYNDTGGVPSVEVYNSSFATNGPSRFWPDGTRLVHHQGSGEFMIFKNVFAAASGKSDTAISLTYYRSASGYGTRCDGTQPVDGNRSPTATYYGYPCYHQPGRRGDKTLSPIYVWNNQWSDTGGVVNISVEDPFGSGTPSPFTHLKSDRDYFNYVGTGFNGTSGTGMGPLANRPSTCTTSSESGGGVGYWATDTTTLYRCSATNTWVAHYRPYAYPHPLTQTGNPVALSAPSGLRIVP